MFAMPLMERIGTALKHPRPTTLQYGPRHVVIHRETRRGWAWPRWTWDAYEGEILVRQHIGGWHPRDTVMAIYAWLIDGQLPRSAWGE